MTAWTSDQLSTIGGADALELAPRRGNGTLRKGVTIWVVRVGDDLYVRSCRGHDGARFRAAQVHQSGPAASRRTSPSWRKPIRASTTRSTPRTTRSTAATQATSCR